MDALKKVPSNAQAEQCVLSAIINNSSFIKHYEHILKVDDFYVDKHKTLYKAILKLYRDNENVDLVTLLDYLKIKDELNSCGGVSYITNITTESDFSVNFKEHVNILKDKSLRRNAIKASKDFLYDAYNEEDMAGSIEKMQDSMFKLSSLENPEEVSDMSDVLNELLDVIDKKMKKIKEPGMSTGFKEVDDTIGELEDSKFIVLAARPSMGKTALALNMGQFASKKGNVCIFSLEMDKVQLANRMMSASTVIEYEKIKTQDLNVDELGQILLGATKLSKRNLYIDDRTLNLNDIKAKCSMLKAKEGLDLVIIDYLQLIESDEKSFSREQDIAKISRELKKLSKRLDITIIALSQLSRAPEQRNDHRPLLSDLRESGSIEQDADVIMMLYRDSYYNKEAKKNVAELIIGKNRNGETRTINLLWYGQYQRFKSLNK